MSELGRGYLVYTIEGVIGNYLDEYSSKDLPYEDIRGLTEHLVNWMLAVELDIKYILKRGKEEQQKGDLLKEITKAQKKE